MAVDVHISINDRCQLHQAVNLPALKSAAAGAVDLIYRVTDRPSVFVACGLPETHDQKNRRRRIPLTYSQLVAHNLRDVQPIAFIYSGFMIARSHGENLFAYIAE